MIYFILNERCQDYFMHNEDKYENLVKRLFFIGIYGDSEKSPDFIPCFEKWFEGTRYTNHVLGVERHKYNLKLKDSILEIDELKTKIEEFINPTNPRIELSAMAVVMCNGKILSTNEMIYGKETVSLPKGHKEENESIIETAIRECYEETNIIITKEDLVKELTSYSYEFLTPSNKLIRKTIVPFLFEVKEEGNPIPKEERMISVQWMDTNKFLDKCTHENVKEIVNTFMLKESSKKFINELEKNYVIPASIYTQTFTQVLESYLGGYIQAASEMMGGQLKDEEGWLIAPAPMDEATINQTVQGLMSQAMIQGLKQTMATQMTEAVMKKDILTNVGNLTQTLMGSVANAFDVNPDKIAAAFKFDLSEEELQRIMSTMMSSNEKKSAASNLSQLGYQDVEEPTNMSFYFSSFEAKERFIEFIDEYNEKQENKNDEDKVIRYTDLTGILMSSVKTIVNSVSYVLIAFVSISLVVSSIMIGIITYISVLERTKEIGILRAIGASKGNISSIFNAETFIIGLLSGLFGIGFTLLAIPVINLVIHNVTGNMDINAVLPLVGGVLLVILSVVLTCIGGLIPSYSASKKDPVVALRTE